MVRILRKAQHNPEGLKEHLNEFMMQNPFDWKDHLKLKVNIKTDIENDFFRVIAMDENHICAVANPYDLESEYLKLDYQGEIIERARFSDTENCVEQFGVSKDKMVLKNGSGLQTKTYLGNDCPDYPLLKKLIENGDEETKKIVEHSKHVEISNELCLEYVWNELLGPPGKFQSEKKRDIAWKWVHSLYLGQGEERALIMSDIATGFPNLNGQIYCSNNHVIVCRDTPKIGMQEVNSEDEFAGAYVFSMDQI
jgi:hypothetical protein